MLEISPGINIEESELIFDYIRASGPGGQNINKVATAVQLRFDVNNSQSLTNEIKTRLLRLAGTRATQNGIIVIVARNFRTQEQNRLEAIRRLSVLIEKARIKPKVRRPTKPSTTAKAARVNEKKRRGAIKRTRRYNPEEWE